LGKQKEQTLQTKSANVIAADAVMTVGRQREFSMGDKHVGSAAG